MLSPSTTPRQGFWLPIFAGLCASLVSIGLARFAYTPLIPSLIEAHWFAPAMWCTSAPPIWWVT